jgi:hypothetical protein
VIGHNGLEVPSMLQGKCKIIHVQNNLSLVNLLACTCLLFQIQGDTSYACPTNSEHNSIQASIFKKHILATHPSIHNKVNPPDHTIIIEADISSLIAKKAHRKIIEHIRHRIITTCRDADVMAGTKHIDPALCIYVSSRLICIDNKHLKDKVSRGNGTICRVIGIKLKEEPQS